MILKNFDENFQNSLKSFVNILDEKFRKYPVLCCPPLGKLKCPTFEEKVFATLKTSLECDRPTWKSYAMEEKSKHALYAHQGEHVDCFNHINMQYELNVQTSNSNK